MIQRANVNKKYLKQVVFSVKGKAFRQGKNLGPMKAKAEVKALLLQMLGLAASFLFQGKRILLSIKVLI